MRKRRAIRWYHYATPFLPWSLRALQHDYMATHFEQPRPAIKDYAFGRLIDIFGPEVEDWPDEVGVQLPRITRHNDKDQWSYAELVEEMKYEFGFIVAMAQDTLEAGRYVRFTRDYNHPGWAGHNPRACSNAGY